jgi:hypothetical protein
MRAPAKGTYRETVNVVRMIPHFRPQAHWTYKKDQRQGIGGRIFLTSEYNVTK